MVFALIGKDKKQQKQKRSLTCEKTEIPKARMGALFPIPSLHPYQPNNDAGMAIGRIGDADFVGAHSHGRNNL